MRRSLLCLLTTSFLVDPAAGWANMGEQKPAAPFSELSVRNLPPDFFDFKAGDAQKKPASSIWLKTSDWVIDQRDFESRRIQNFGAWLDATLSGETLHEQNNQSFIRIGFASRISRLDSAYLKPEGRFRLDLPTTRERLRLVIENNPVESQSLQQRQRDRLLTSNDRPDTGTFGALRLITRLARRWSLSTDVGIKLGLPPKPFWRARASTDWDVNAQWSARTEEKLYYFYIDGWGASSQLNLARDLPGDWHLVSSSQIRWIEKQDRFEWGQTFSDATRLNVRATLTGRVGIVGTSGPNWRTDDIFTDLTYRYRLYSDWLYGEVIPAYEFTRLSGGPLQNNPSITLRIEMFFAGGEINRDFSN